MQGKGKETRRFSLMIDVASSQARFPGTLAGKRKEDGAAAQVTARP